MAEGTPDGFTSVARLHQRAKMKDKCLADAAILLYEHPEVTQPLIDRVPKDEWCTERALLELAKEAVAAKEADHA